MVAGLGAGHKAPTGLIGAEPSGGPPHRRGAACQGTWRATAWSGQLASGHPAGHRMVWSARVRAPGGAHPGLVHPRQGTGRSTPWPGRPAL